MSSVYDESHHNKQNKTGGSYPSERDAECVERGQERHREIRALSVRRPAVPTEEEARRVLGGPQEARPAAVESRVVRGHESRITIVPSDLAEASVS
jgi:hypothetical protein